MLLDLLFFAPPASLLPTLIAGLFGLLIGSFLNVVIYRIPKMMQRESDNYVARERGEPEPHTDRYNLVLPRSACPHCKHQIGALENVPVISYLVLRGQCRACKAPISARYPIIEACTGLLSAGLIWQFGSGVAGLASLPFLYLLIVMTFIDADTQYLPDELTVPLLWMGIALNLSATFTTLQDAVIGAIIGYLVLWSVNALFKLVRGKDGMGGGDFKLLAAFGAWMGWAILPSVILLSSVVGSVVGVSMMLFRKHQREVPIPFGPYLAGAGLIALVYQAPIIAYTKAMLVPVL